MIIRVPIISVNMHCCVIFLLCPDSLVIGPLVPVFETFFDAVGDFHSSQHYCVTFMNGFCLENETWE